MSLILVDSPMKKARSMSIIGFWLTLYRRSEITLYLRIPTTVHYLCPLGITCFLAMGRLAVMAIAMKYMFVMMWMLGFKPKYLSYIFTLPSAVLMLNNILFIEADGEGGIGVAGECSRAWSGNMCPARTTSEMKIARRP